MMQIVGQRHYAQKTSRYQEQIPLFANSVIVCLAEIERTAYASEKKLLKSVELFDVYEGDKLPAGKKSYAVNFILEDKERTLTDTVINKVIGNILHNLESKLGAQQR